MTYDLSKLGWKAFQDLVAAVVAQVLKRPVQTFLGSNDGGRDGAFLGRWDGPDGTTEQSTIQCKFIEKHGANLVLSGLTDELAKAEKLAKAGLADDYLIFTNAGVTGTSDAKIRAAFQEVGVKKCRTFGGSWITQQLTESPRLRMLVPRVYGIGDLSHVITGHGYTQGKAILDSMGSDLSCFVPTAAYRTAVEALHEHRFVILLGDPASGKSTIAAILALGAIDAGCLGALKINSPDQLNLWHPGEKQFLWVDDAFGPNHFDVARMHSWNARLGNLRAAVEQGARIVFTSRNYIWEAARPHLKMSAFPLFKESQVVVNVQALSEEERAQMLYNHVRRVQPKEMRTRFKPYLPAIAANNAFLPETARRLGDPLFTKNLVVTEARLIRLVEQPVEFLTEILAQLDDASRAAVSLVFLNSQSGVPSPVTATPALDMVIRLTGVSHAEIARAMEHLNDSVTRRVSEEEGDRWVFRHPTVNDAFATLVAGSPELVELYVHGAKIDRLLNEVACKATAAEGGRIRVPPTLYGSLIARLETYPLNEPLKSFLGARCDKTFLRKILQVRPDIIEWVPGKLALNHSLGGKLLVAALASYGLLPEELRKKVVADVREHSIEWFIAEPLRDKVLRQIFTDTEFSEYTEAFRQEWLSNFSSLLGQFSQYSSDDEISLYTDFKENLQVAQSFFGLEGDLKLEDVLSGIDAHIQELEDEQPPYSGATLSPPTLERSDEQGFEDTDSIFSDVDT
ncbi:hypothetical protein C8J31_11487 [Rhizobium sp. PP-CC-2G-626]|nr:hypothetical protein C8J31_11487 [Rhizobium sp. PP-CC-2G-626]